MKFVSVYISALLLICFKAAGYSSELPADNILLQESANNEIVTAPWEREADSEIMAKAALNAAVNGDRLIIDLFCSEKSVMELTLLRNTLVGFLQSRTMTAASKSAAMDFLYNVGKSVPDGLSDAELAAINAADLSVSANTPFKTTDLSHKEQPGNCAWLLSAASAVACPAQTFCNHAPQSLYKKKFCYSGAVLISRENEIDHADLYRLFLYVRDNTGAGRCPVLYTSPGSALFLFYHLLSNSIRHKKHQNTKTRLYLKFLITRVICSTVCRPTAFLLYSKKQLFPGGYFSLYQLNIPESLNEKP